MEQLFESALCMELAEEVAGHDPVFYEDISKQQHEFTTVPPHVNIFQEDLIEGQMSGENGLDFLPGSAENQLESLLAEGNLLLEQLMSDHGLGLSPDSPINLTDIDELAEKTADVVNELPFEQYELHPQDDLLPIYMCPDADYPLAESPASSISTLPSEPSSPVNLFSPVHTEHETTEFTDLLQSLIDDNTESDMTCGGFFEESMLSPASSSDDSYTGSYMTPSPSASSWTPDNSDLESPTKSKKKKSKSTPYSKLPAGRKERKKQQNKEAAIRYREKKRGEAQGIQEEESHLSEKNQLLKTEVLNLEREILCMKELLSDVFDIHSL